MNSFPQGYRTIAMTPADTRRFWELDAWAFPTNADLDDIAKLPLPLEWSRAWGVVGPDNDELVAQHSSYSMPGFTVPGGQVSAAGLSSVGVHPGHRRRGLLTAMIGDHLMRTAERKELFSVLFASEMGIYGRFGYGLASDSVRLKIDRGAVLRPVAGSDDLRVRIDHADEARHSDLVTHLHAAASHNANATGLNRPGWDPRHTAARRAALWSDVAALRRNSESLRIAIVEQGSEPRGYALFRRSENWQMAGPRGTLTISEVSVLDAAAARALWAVLLDLDHMATIETSMLAVDDPLMQLLVDRRAALPSLRDNLWLRLVDVPGALAARRYAAPLDLVLKITDTLIPTNAGCWHVQAEAFAQATVTATTRAADISIDVADLATAYLGRQPLAALAGAGLVREHTDGSLAIASAAFGWPIAPFCGAIF